MEWLHRLSTFARTAKFTTIPTLLAVSLLLPQILALAEEPKAEPLNPEQRQAVEKLVKDLESIKATPDLIPKVLDQITTETQRVESEISELDQSIAKLKEDLAAKRDRVEKVRSGKAFEEAKAQFLGAAPSGSIVPAGGSVKKSLDFNRDIRPILSNNCFACHGPDEKTRKAGLRLDEEESAKAALQSGNHGIFAGDRTKSEVYLRISTSDPADKMPPASFEKVLKDEEIELIGKWIDEGAEWGRHWAFVTPQRPEIPAVQLEGWAKNPIDKFILAKLESKGLSPSPEADKRTLIRRVTLDLTGLPPTLEEVEEFLADDSPAAYEKLVARLLDKPQYGEHMAKHWLDLARYADTNGYHIDNERYMWVWRDWVIKAFNENKPFDQFTIEQLAGDLLPNPSQDQIIATGFNRNHMINFEGGAIPEEYHAAYVMDRVNTLGTTFLGMTVACAQCHDHKYDPLTTKEYYQLYSFFNTIPEVGLDGRDGNAVPFVKAPSQEEQAKLASLKETIQTAEEALNQPMPELDARQGEWEVSETEKLKTRWTPLSPTAYTSSGEAEFTLKEDQSLLVGGANPNTDTYEVQYEVAKGGTVYALRLEALTDETRVDNSPGRATNGNFVLSEFEAEILRKASPETAEPLPFSEAKADHSQEKFPIEQAIDGDPATGWAAEGFTRHESRTAVFTPKSSPSLQAGDILKIRLRHESEFAGHGIGRFRVSISTDVALAPSNLGNWYANGPFIAPDGKTAFEKAYPPEDHINLQETYPDGRLMWVEMPEYSDGQIHNLKANTAATYLYRKIDAPTAREMDFSIGSNDAVALWVNGNQVHSNNVQRGIDSGRDKVKVQLKQGENEILLKVVDYGGSYAFFFAKEAEQRGEHPFEIDQILLTAKDARSAEQSTRLRDYYRGKSSPEWREKVDALAKAKTELSSFENSLPTVMVMQEMEEPRQTHMLIRGQYDQLGDVVQPVLPAAFPGLPEGAEANRLGLAKWLVSREHPLTARVTLNRYWQRLFGTGIVKTSEDFGSQGEWPVNPELLDWLAVEFIESGWDVKNMMRLMVTSAAYRQSSVVTPQLLEADPNNRLLARGPRIRLDAETVRDSALALSGLLVGKIGGPSVKPYQPAGIWEEVSYGAGFSAQSFDQGEGEELYRRSMYTFWKRQSPPPTMLIFDAPNREVCSARRSRTNTPLQALVLLNDPQFVEAARCLAQKMIKEGGETPIDRIGYAFQMATARPMKAPECGVLEGIFQKHLARYKENPDDAKKLIEVGDSEPDASLDPAELAAYTNIATMIFNLDEVITNQ
jgi:hypothetical protein